jgi:hypothetical protein
MMGPFGTAAGADDKRRQEHGFTTVEFVEEQLEWLESQ